MKKFRRLKKIGDSTQQVTVVVSPLVRTLLCCCGEVKDWNFDRRENGVGKVKGEKIYELFLVERVGQDWRRSEIVPSRSRSRLLLWCGHYLSAVGNRRLVSTSFCEWNLREEEEEGIPFRKLRHRSVGDSGEVGEGQR